MRHLIGVVAIVTGEGGASDIGSSRSPRAHTLTEKRSIAVPKLKSIGGLSQTRYHAKQTPRGSRSSRAAVAGESFPLPSVQVRMIAWPCSILQGQARLANSCEYVAWTGMHICGSTYTGTGTSCLPCSAVSSLSNRMPSFLLITSL